MDWKDVQSVEEILPECPGLNGSSQIPVRSRENPHVYSNGLAASHPFKFSFLEYAQKGALGLPWELTDLIEEDRTSIGQLKSA